MPSTRRRPGRVRRPRPARRRAACGVCGRVAIADLELRAREVVADTTIAHAVIATLPDGAARGAVGVRRDRRPPRGRAVHDRRRAGRVRARMSAATTRSTSSSAGRSRRGSIPPATSCSCRDGCGYELVQKAIMLGRARRRRGVGAEHRSRSSSPSGSTSPSSGSCEEPAPTSTPTAGGSPVVLDGEPAETRSVSSTR